MTRELIFYGTVDAQGRITIPKRIRERLKIVPGTIVVLKIRRETFPEPDKIYSKGVTKP